MWSTTIWRKTWGDQALLGLAFAVLWAAFPWLYIGLSAQIEMNAFQDVLLRAWAPAGGLPCDARPMREHPSPKPAIWPG